jgi:hypothetical protein
MNTETAPLTASSPQVCATTASKFALSDGGITMVGQTRFLESRQIGNGKSASVYECGRTWSLHLHDKLIRTWELLRFHSKLEKSSDEVEDVKDDRPIGPAYERSTFWPRV